MVEDHDLDTKLLAHFIKKKYHDRKPVDFRSARVEEATTIGDNYGSNVYRVEFQVTTASGRKQRKSVIVKTTARWTIELREEESHASSPVFRWETMIYTTILPLMEDLMEEFEDRRGTLWPSMIGYRPYNLIAVEDLTETLFHSPVRKYCLNFDQSVLVLRSLARFHAMSKALMTKGLISQHEKGRILLAMDNDFIKKLWFAYFTMLSKGMEEWGGEWKDISTKLSQLSKGITGRWAELSKDYDDRFSVLNHGDLWMCNLLIQNTEFEGVPVAVKFVDFQGAHINSFIWDVVYFLYSSTAASVRRGNMELLLMAYQESLKLNLEYYGFKGHIPTLEDVRKECERLEFVSMCCLLLHPLMLSEKQLNMAKIPSHPPEDVIDGSVYSDGKAKAAIGEDLMHFYRRGLMDAKTTPA